jgi:hypothetical protein
MGSRAIQKSAFRNHANIRTNPDPSVNNGTSQLGCIILLKESGELKQ